MLYHVICRPPGSNTVKWFKFDDGEVTEAKIDDEEVRSSCNVVVEISLSLSLSPELYGLTIIELSSHVVLQEFKAQCFGGEFTGEVYDHVLKK